MTPFWILTDYRCGSGHLCDLLNKSQAFSPIINEYFHLDRNISLDYFLKNPNEFRYSKVMSNHFQNSKLTRQVVENALPGVKFIRLKRIDDLISRTISFFVASRYGKWHYTKPVAISLQFDEEELIAIYKNLKRQEGFWELAGFSDVVQIAYKDLISNPAQELRKCASLLKLSNIDWDSIIQSPGLSPTKWPWTEEFKIRLKEAIERRHAFL